MLQALRIVSVCDPACGSGAYLLGMLHELLDLREALFRTTPLDTASVYARKLEIIQNNLYGVDRDQFAVDIGAAAPLAVADRRFRARCGQACPSAPEPRLQDRAR